MAMKMIGLNVMAVTIKLTERILCCATDENAKDRKLDIFVMFAPKSSIGKQIFFGIETRVIVNAYKCNYCQKSTSTGTIARLIKKVVLHKVHFVNKRNRLFLSHVEKYLQVTRI